MAVLITPNQIGLREDLTTLDLMGDKLTVMYNKAKKGVAINPHHEWLEDNMAPGNASNAYVQGATFNFSTTDTKQRMGNWTQIFQNLAALSRTSIQSKLANGNNFAVVSELTFQKEKAMRQTARDIDAAMLTGTSQVPTATLPGKMGGIIQLTNTANQYTNATTGVLAWDDIDSGLTKMIEAGADPDTLICQPVMKGTIAKLNRTEAPYQTVVYADQKATKGLEGHATFFEGSNASVEIYADPRQAANTITMFEADKTSLEVLGRANVENSIQFDGIGLAIVTECCLKLTHSKAAAVMVMA